MASAFKVCKVCGNKYEVCHSGVRGDSTFRWQDVACCEKCGAEYLKQVMISRGLIEEAPKPKAPKKTTRATKTTKKGNKS